jgi:hypothetical protein
LTTTITSGTDSFALYASRLRVIIVEFFRTLAIPVVVDVVDIVVVVVIRRFELLAAVTSNAGAGKGRWIKP